MPEITKQVNGKSSLLTLEPQPKSRRSKEFQGHRTASFRRCSSGPWSCSAYPVRAGRAAEVGEGRLLAAGFSQMCTSLPKSVCGGLTLAA